MARTLVTGMYIKTDSMLSINTSLGGSGFIANELIGLLIKRGDSVVTTVRSPEKGEKIKALYPGVSADQFSYVIVEDIAKPDGKLPIRMPWYRPSLTRICQLSTRLWWLTHPWRSCIIRRVPFTTITRMQRRNSLSQVHGPPLRAWLLMEC